MTARLTLTAIFAALAFSHAVAAPSDWPEFEPMLQAPDDPAAVYPFVNRAITEDDLSAAANAMERLVRFRPDDQQARIDLITLYDALGASDLAAGLIDQAREGDLSSEQEAVLARIDSGVTISGGLTVGVAYDTNPSAIPRADVVSILSPTTNQVVQLDLGVEEAPSPQGFFRAEGTLRRNASGDLPALVFDLSIYGAFNERDKEQNDFFGEARAGPEFDLLEASVRPYVLGGYRTFGMDPYASRIGGGVEVISQIADDVFLSLDGGLAYRNRLNPVGRANQDDEDGWEAQLSAAFSTNITDDVLGQLSFGAARYDAREDYESYFLLSTGLYLATDVEFGARTLTLGAGASAAYSKYDGPDDTLLPGVTREELALNAFLSASTEIAEDTDIEGVLGFRRREANIAIFESEGFRAALQLTRRF
ncbi:MAG: hypothetical protein AAF401_09265 [Pseudomonadota bacterium]